MTGPKLVQIARDGIELGRRVHQCSVCGAIGTWGPHWQWYGSYKQLESGDDLVKTCSDNCRREAEAKGMAE